MTAEIIQLHFWETRNGSDPEYIIEGNYANVQMKVDELLDRYPPCAYGTQILTDHIDCGVRTVRMTRYHSCD
jgi:hypothetical protein